jgi:electron transfer flavoprotein alpha subunit
MILGFVEHDRGELSPLSLQALTVGYRLAEGMNAPLHAVLIGADAEPLADELASYGVSRINMAEHERLDGYAPGAWAQCIVELMRENDVGAALAAGSERGLEVMAHVAARTGLPLAANCIDVWSGGPFAVTRLRWGGSLLEQATLEGEVKLLTIAPHAIAAEQLTAAGEADIHRFTPALSEADFRVRVMGRVEPEAGKISLADARVVVGGGRGVGSAEGFRMLEELAGLLGGTVGCSRAVTSLGWRPHSDQVGQTGTRIAPEVYIACGISGAIQHMVGCKSAKRIVAINKDAEAPIMGQADYAIVGDVQQIVPALIDAIRSVKRDP